MSDEAQQRYARASEPALRTLRMTRQQSAYLYVVLVDNARGWNADIRAQLAQVVSDTEAFNARLELSGGK